MMSRPRPGIDARTQRTEMPRPVSNEDPDGVWKPEIAHVALNADHDEFLREKMSLRQV